jgi:4'-phosphopantetheinyl transferase
MTLAMPAGSAVHVWWADLDAPDSAVERMRAVLDEDELRRADAMAHDNDRKRLIVRRAMLREILGGYLGLAPGHILITAGSNGKLSASRAGGLDFNCSSSGSRAVVACARGARVGIDVEERRGALWDGFPVAGYLSATERARLRSEPEQLRGRMAAQAWVTKEAIAKATGIGFSVSPADLELDGDPECPRVRFAGGFAAFAADSWWVRLVDAGTNRVAALALDRDWAVSDVGRWEPGVRV